MRVVSPKELHENFPINESTKNFILQSRNTIREIISGKDPRKLLIIGPCSVHDISSILVYSRVLKKFSTKLKDQFFIVMRCFFEKSRSEGAWKGILHDPYLDGSNALDEGLLRTRKLLMDLAKLELPVASEFVHPIFAPYFQDLISWVMIGARTVSSPVHRELASSFDFPVGIKNTTDGNMDIATQAIYVSNHPHEWLQLNEEGQMTLQKSSGNPYTHLVLRGSETSMNFDSQNVRLAIQKLKDKKLNPKVLIDCSHGNCQKKHECQITSFQSVLQQILEGNDSILGWMLESNLFEGNQPILPDKEKMQYGVSITDQCMSWRETEKLLLHAYQQLQSARV